MPPQKLKQKHDSYKLVCFDPYNKQVMNKINLTVYRLCNINVSVPSEDPQIHVDRVVSKDIIFDSVVCSTGKTILRSIFILL